MDLSIIVPVYNVEAYIRPCIESILGQGLDERCYEVIIVNDGTEDCSMEQIDDLIAAHDNIITINQKNQGLSVARNNGLQKATGDYILFVDSDDLLFTNTVSFFLEDIRKYHPELLIAGFVRMTDDEIMKMKEPEQATYSSSIKPELMPTIDLLNPRECYVWRTFYKRAFLYKHSILFVPGICFEDIPFSTECYLKAKKCVYTNFPLYIYRQRVGSIVSSIDLKKVMDFNTVIANLWKMRNMVSTAKEYAKLMNIIFCTHQVQNWFIVNSEDLLAERKTITKDLRKKVPNLYFCGSIIERTESFFYRYMPNVYLLLKSLMKDSSN